MYAFDNGRFKEAHVWWDTEIDPTADVDVFFFIHDFKGRAQYKYGFKTLQIDLTKPKEGIQSNYKSNIRNELRNSRKIDYKVEFLNKPTDEQIIRFTDLFNGFADFKKIGKTSRGYLKKLASEGKLVISYVRHDGEILFGHSHYVSGGIARLLQSFSSPTEQERKIVMLSNKRLTDEDIFYFKKAGASVYDFGGIGNVEGDNSRFEGIIKFKKSFGGKEVILWKGVTPNGQRGMLVIKKYFKNIEIK